MVARGNQPPLGRKEPGKKKNACQRPSAAKEESQYYQSECVNQLQGEQLEKMVHPSELGRGGGGED